MPDSLSAQTTAGRLVSAQTRAVGLVSHAPENTFCDPPNPIPQHFISLI